MTFKLAPDSFNAKRWLEERWKMQEFREERRQQDQRDNEMDDAEEIEAKIAMTFANPAIRDADLKYAALAQLKLTTAIGMKAGTHLEKRMEGSQYNIDVADNDPTLKRARKMKMADLMGEMKPTLKETKLKYQDVTEWQRATSRAIRGKEQAKTTHMIFDGNPQGPVGALRNDKEMISADGKRVQRGQDEGLDIPAVNGSPVEYKWIWQSNLSDHAEGAVRTLAIQASADGEDTIVWSVEVFEGDLQEMRRIIEAKKDEEVDLITDAGEIKLQVTKGKKKEEVRAWTIGVMIHVGGAK